MKITEKELVRIIRESIEEITAQTIQNAINNRHKRIANKEKNNSFYRENGFGDIDRERTINQVDNIEKNYNELYCSPYTNDNIDQNNRDDFSVSFAHNRENGKYSMNGPAFGAITSKHDKNNLAKNPRFRKWQRDNGM